MSSTNYLKIRPILWVFILSCMVLPKVFGKSNAVSQNECAKALTSVEKRDQILKAVKNNDPEGVEFFIELHDIDGPQIDQMEALHHAARLGHTSIAVLLMQLGADPDFETTDGTPYQIALDENNIKVANIIKDNSKLKSPIKVVDNPMVESNDDVVSITTSTPFSSAILPSTLSEDAKKVLKKVKTEYDPHEKAYEVTGPRKRSGNRLFYDDHHYMRAKIVTNSQYQREVKTVQIYVKAKFKSEVGLNRSYSEGKQLDLTKVTTEYVRGLQFRIEEHVVIHFNIEELLEEFIKEKPFNFVVKSTLQWNSNRYFSIPKSYIRGFTAALSYVMTQEEIDHREE